MPNNKIVNGRGLQHYTQQLWEKLKTKFISNVTVVDRDNLTAKSKLRTNKLDGSQVDNEVVTRWKDLDEVKEYQFANVLNPESYVNGRLYNAHRLSASTPKGFSSKNEFRVSRRYGYK